LSEPFLYFTTTPHKHKGLRRCVISKKKQETKSSQTNTASYGWEKSPITPEIQGVIDIANKPVSINPAIQGMYGQLEGEIKNSYNDPFGSYTNQDVKEKSLRSNLHKLAADKGRAMNEGFFDAENQQFGRKVAAAGMTAPQLVQTGSTSTGNQTTQQGGGFWGSVLGSVISGAAMTLCFAFLMELLVLCNIK